MNRTPKKMTQKPKPQPQPRRVGAVVATREKRAKTTPVRPPVAVKATNGATSLNEPVKGLEEYLVYKKLKEEVGEFYPYPGLWLEAPHQLLGGRTPLEIALASREGNEFILDMIQSIKAGYFS